MQKKIKCKGCERDYLPQNGWQKYCTLQCRYESFKLSKSKKPKRKKCMHCGNQFNPYTSLDKFCSVNCRILNQKSKRSRNWNNESCEKRKGKGNPSYKTGMYVVTTKKDGAGQREFMKIRNLIRKQKIEKYGHLFCDLCGTNSSYQWEMHHLIFRSEKPKHQYLHDPRNLIDLCMKCHNWFHSKKSRRNPIVQERNLAVLFGQDIIIYEIKNGVIINN